jgi:hypothetical protein
MRLEKDLWVRGHRGCKCLARIFGDYGAFEKGRQKYPCNVPGTHLNANAKFKMLLCCNRPL